MRMNHLSCANEKIQKKKSEGVGWIRRPAACAYAICEKRPALLGEIQGRTTTYSLYLFSQYDGDLKQTRAFHP